MNLFAFTTFSRQCGGHGGGVLILAAETEEDAIAILIMAEDEEDKEEWQYDANQFSKEKVTLIGKALEGQEEGYVLHEVSEG